MMPIPLLLATRNPGKLREYRQMLEGLSLEILSLDDALLDLQVEETGSTFAENALLKAQGYSRASGMLTLADDSGLEVDALDGEPGVRSSRYAGPDATDNQRNRILLDRMADVAPADRTARFRCAIAVVSPDGRSWVVEGSLEGLIALQPEGEGGFGYDPVFLLPQTGMTAAQLTPQQKNRISHRGQALRKARAILRGIGSVP
jgi:XTP/dITP diphosphohydrolase